MQKTKKITFITGHASSSMVRRCYNSPIHGALDPQPHPENPPPKPQTAHHKPTTPPPAPFPLTSRTLSHMPPAPCLQPLTPLPEFQLRPRNKNVTPPGAQTVSPQPHTANPTRHPKPTWQQSTHSYLIPTPIPRPNPRNHATIPAV